MTEYDEIRILRAQMETLSRRVTAIEDVHAVRTLHFKYGYYIDMCLYDEAVDLFAEDAELTFLNGLYHGKEGARRLYCGWLRNMLAGGHNGPVYGLLLDHIVAQDIVDISPDGTRAKGRFRNFMQAGYHDSVQKPDNPMPPQCWEAGIYENEYIKEDGVWKFWRFNYNMLWQADYEQGWAHSGVHLRPLTRTYPEDPIGPDTLLPITPVTWPERRVVPFHYPHPVTGKAWEPVQ